MKPSLSEIKKRLEAMLKQAQSTIQLEPFWSDIAWLISEVELYGKTVMDQQNENERLKQTLDVAREALEKNKQEWRAVTKEPKYFTAYQMILKALSKINEQLNDKEK